MAQWPVGTTKELEEVGLSPAEFATCSPAGEQFLGDGELVKRNGCDFWKRGKDAAPYSGMECLFAKDCAATKSTKGAKAFRGKGPKNIAYFIRLDKSQIRPGEQLPANQVMFSPCYLFEANMRGRFENQRAGGERIIVVGVEGDGQKFKQRVVKMGNDPNNPAGPRIRIVGEEMQEIPLHPRPAEVFGSLEMDRAAADSFDERGEAEVIEDIEKHLGMALPSMVAAPSVEPIEQEKPRGKKT